MRKTMVLVAAATMFMGSSVATAADFSMMRGDTTVVENSNARRGELTRSIVGGLLKTASGSVAGKGKEVTDSISKKTQETVSQGKERVGTGIGNVLGGLRQSAQKVNDSKAKASAVGGILGSVLGGAKGAANGGQEGELKDKVGGLIGAIVGDKVALTADKVVGTWNYKCSKCVLESDDVLKKAGSELLTAPLEEKMTKGLERVGFKEGSCSYTFNEDGTFTTLVGGRTMKGDYTLDTEKKTITLNMVRGLLHSTVDIQVMGNQMSLLYDADKLLKFASMAASISNSSAIKTLNSVLNSYNGMKVGLEFSK